MKRLIAWWKWLRKDGWALKDVRATEYSGGNWLWPVRCSPYFIEVWQNTETGEVREVEKC